ncbi:MAG: hypothetical protein HY901_21205 [Deltaproteobacteria bacterium]|nr:hypothetical protein [Deltaproteobacteria bacterium]
MSARIAPLGTVPRPPSPTLREGLRSFVILQGMERLPTGTPRSTLEPTPRPEPGDEAAPGSRDRAALFAREAPGPRPLPVPDAQRLVREHPPFALRLAIAPGITGPAQVSQARGAALPARLDVE